MSQIVHTTQGVGETLRDIPIAEGIICLLISSYIQYFDSWELDYLYRLLDLVWILGFQVVRPVQPSCQVTCLNQDRDLVPIEMVNMPLPDDIIVDRHKVTLSQWSLPFNNNSRHVLRTQMKVSYHANIASWPTWKFARRSCYNFWLACFSATLDSNCTCMGRTNVVGTL